MSNAAIVQFTDNVLMAYNYIAKLLYDKSAAASYFSTWATTTRKIDPKHNGSMLEDRK